MNELTKTDSAGPRGLRHDDELLCPQCDAAQLIRRHCKTVCESCGYVESCEDNFLPTRANPRQPSGTLRVGSGRAKGC